MGLKKYLPKRWWLRYPLYAGVGLVVLLAVDVGLTWYWRQIEIGVETTRITTPLTAKGYPDYAAALNDKMGAGVTKENNAAVLLLRLWPEKTYKTAQAKGILKALDIEVGFAPVRWEDFETYVKRTTTAPVDEEHEATTRAEEPGELVERLRTVPWRGAEYPQVAAWLEANRAALEVVRQASLRERFYVPVVDETGRVRGAEPGGVWNGLLGAIMNGLEPSKMLLLKALQCLGEGDTAGYERDVVVALGCARVKMQPTAGYMYLLLGLNEKEYAYRVLQIGLGSGQLDAAQRERLAAMLVRMGEPVGMVGVYDVTHRWASLDLVAGLARPGRSRRYAVTQGYAGTMPGIEAFDYLKPVNYNEALRNLNRHYDQIVEMVQIADYASRQNAVRAWERELGTAQWSDLVDEWVGCSRYFAKVLLPSLSGMNTKHTTVRAQRQITLGMLALARERADKGAYPETFPAGLMDPFTGQALVYRREGAGYVLYSVGPDGKDDGGKAPAERSSRDQDYDLVVRVER